MDLGSGARKTLYNKGGDGYNINSIMDSILADSSREKRFAQEERSFYVKDEEKAVRTGRQRERSRR